MSVQIVNADTKYRPPSFAPPPPSGWLYLAASVAPPSGPPFVRSNAARDAVLRRLGPLAAAARRLPGVEQVSVFRAVLVPPFGGGVRRPARFDVAVLVRTSSLHTLADVRDAAPVEQLVDALGSAATDVNVMTARCARYLGPVDPDPRALFLFNHFAPAAGAEHRGAELDSATELWEHLAAWYVAETGLTNSTLLGPTEPSDYLFVNHASWNVGLARFTATQFRKKSFRTYVRANLAANRIVAMPVLYRLA